MKNLEVPPPCDTATADEKEEEAGMKEMMEDEVSSFRNFQFLKQSLDIEKMMFSLAFECFRLKKMKRWIPYRNWQKSWHATKKQKKF